VFPTSSLVYQLKLQHNDYSEGIYMPHVGSTLYRLDKQIAWQGFVTVLPIAFFVSAFGAAFGLAAAQAGIQP